MTLNLLCPVCSGRTITVYGLNDEMHSAKCNDCGTYDALHKFEAAELTHNLGLGAQFDKEMIFPPDDIIACERRMHHYFMVERHCKQWAFGHVQSRDEPALIGIEHVRNMAAAFRMELIVRPDSEAFTQKIIEGITAAINADETAKQLRENDIDFLARMVEPIVSKWLFPK